MTDATVTVVHPPILIRKRGRAGLRSRWWIHNSGRFDRPSNLWGKAIATLRRKGWLITGTEAAGRDANQFRWALAGSDWAYAHLSGAAEGECYATWDSTVADLVGHPWAHKLTDLTWTRSKDYGGKKAAKVHALVVRLRVIRSGQRYWVVVVHMPLDNTPARAVAWVDCCRGLVALQADLKRRDPDAELVVVADWNKNLRLRQEAGMVRQNLEKPLRLVTSWALGLPRVGGTHDSQVIDYALVRRPILAACQLLPDGPDSDHRAFRYRLKKEKP